VAANCFVLSSSPSLSTGKDQGEDELKTGLEFYSTPSD